MDRSETTTSVGYGAGWNENGEGTQVWSRLRLTRLFTVVPFPGSLGAKLIEVKTGPGDGSWAVEVSAATSRRRALRRSLLLSLSSDVSAA